jgi:hypothetical protein
MTIVAAYGDRVAGALRVLRAEGGSATTDEMTLAYDAPESWALPGGACSIRFVDLELDRAPEIFVSFHGVRASVVWVFRWDGSTLVNLTPLQTTGDRQASLLLTPVVYDLEHRGSQRLVTVREVGMPPPGQPMRTAGAVYRLGPRGLEPEKSVLAVAGFRGDVPAASNARSFRLAADSKPPFTVRVVNGDRGGQHRVAGASIRLNDVEVLGAADVHGATAALSTTLPRLPVTNRLDVALSGPPDGQLIVVIEDATPR